MNQDLLALGTFLGFSLLLFAVGMTSIWLEGRRDRKDR